jgi:isochorismate synthase
LTGTALIDELIRRKATFAAFRLPGEDARAYVQHSAELQTPHPGQQCFVLAPFDPAEGPVLCINPDIVLAIDEDRATLSGIAERTDGREHTLVRGLDRAGYRNAVAQSINAIRTGHLQKVVLARTIATELGHVTTGALFQAACAAYPSTFVALARTNRFGKWLGATPERLISAERNRIEADSLAGTLPASLAPGTAEAWGEKEREEQRIVTAEIADCLLANGAREVRVDEPAVKRSANLAHLHTRITAISEQQDALRLAAALHPTPAVGGKPASEAFEQIRALEPRPRSLYAGYWGPVEAEQAHLFVNIRCMEIAGQSALVHVGAGITGSSDPEAECNEVELKARSWLSLIEELGNRR